jgi:hypothetical protein
MPACRSDFVRLTRRANQGHIIIIADIVRPAPGNRQRVFLFAAMQFAKTVSNDRINFVAFSAIY